MSKSITIGLLSPVTGGSYYGSILAGVTREVAAVGGRVVLVQTLQSGISSDVEMGAPDFVTPIAWEHVDGVISIATATQRNYLDRLQAAGKAVVLASDVFEGFDVPSATPDNSTGVVASVDHLIWHGHSAIGYGANLVQPDMRARYDAYQRALKDHGIDPDPKWFFAAFDNGEEGGRDVARQFVASGLPITALAFATDRNAIGCMEQLAELGIAVPGDVAVVSFDGLDAGMYTRPTLSTVRQPYEETGALAARLVLAQLRGEAVEPGAHLSPSEFVPRGSCGCPGEGGSAMPDGPAGFWRDEATTGFARIARSENSMREQYEIGIQLLDYERVDPRNLEWLAVTQVRGACLALWDGDPSTGRLRTAGAYDPECVLSDVVGTTCTVEEFPPASLIGLADPRVNEVTIVVPVNAGGLDFGLLAVTGEVDALSSNGRETHNQWAVMLTAALEQQALLENVRTSEERYSLWALATDDGLWDWDLTTDKIYYSGRCMQMLGHDYRGATASKDVWFDVVHPDDLELVRQVLRTAMVVKAEPIVFEHRIRGADGTYRCISCRALPVGPPDGPATRIVGSIHDIEPRKQLEEQLRQGALYDEVTGLPNRKLFLERLSLTIAQARRSPDVRYAVVFLDLDGFKLVNDSLGHHVGDRLLAKIGERLRAELRDTDLAARFGGDEFAMLLHGIDPKGVGPHVARMQASLAESIELDGPEVAVTASVGIKMSGREHTNAEDVLRDADIAMYHAKTLRRGSFAVFDGTMHAGRVTRLGLQAELRTAMECAQFEVHYQPIVDLDNEGTDHFEALVRWRHPEHGLVPPVEFLPAMEEAGLMVRLERWILEEVCRQIARWQRTYDGTVNVSVNVSHRLFLDSGLLPHILDCLRRHGLAPANLTLEIAAGVIVLNPNIARDVIERLHAAGIELEIDNFGTGMSALHALHRFPVHGLKIDRSFIRELDVDARTTALVRIIIEMGEALGVDVVAEGVETGAQLELLQAMGCHKAQGFLFTEAVDGAAASQFLSRLLPVRELATLRPGIGPLD
jgi:diguanylate cyclase (GGDEF)-like protein/PAS domain S-box-containing protein